MAAAAALLLIYGSSHEMHSLACAAAVGVDYVLYFKRCDCTVPVAHTQTQKELPLIYAPRQCQLR